MKTVAVLDLGTNTFHLLIAQIESGGSIKPIFKERRYTKLGEEGISRIGDHAYTRGIECLQYFQSIIKAHNVAQTLTLGTAALRTASNGSQFISDAKSKAEIDITIIDGKKEATYIHRGATAALPELNKPYMIMDIGGGSVEFIISKSGQIQYLDSLPIGLSPLHGIADISDVAQTNDVVRLHQFLAGRLSKLYRAIEQYRPRILVGSAGAFEVLVSMTTGDLGDSKHFSIAAEQLSALYVQILGSSKAEKLKMPGLPAERVDYISAAMVLIWHVYDSVQPEQLLVSKYALKEGALLSFLD